MLLYAKIFAILTLRALITIGRGSEDSGYQHLVHNFANYYPTFNFCFHWQADTSSRFEIKYHHTSNVPAMVPCETLVFIYIRSQSLDRWRYQSAYDRPTCQSRINVSV